MTSSSRRPPRCLFKSPSIFTFHRHFLITMTNSPQFLARSEQYRRDELNLIEMLDDPNDTNAREAALYNTLKQQCQQALRSYLEQTEKQYPITLVFDMSDTSLSR